MRMFIRPRSRSFKKIGGMQSMQRSSRINTFSQYIPIHNLPLLEKDKIRQGQFQQESRGEIFDSSCSVLPHPPYSTGLVPSDFHLFSSQKKFSRRSIENHCGNFLSSKPTEFLLEKNQPVTYQWQEAIENNVENSLNWNKLCINKSYFTKMEIIYNSTWK